MRNDERLSWSLKCRKSVELITKGDMLILVAVVELAQAPGGEDPDSVGADHPRA